VTRAFTVIIEDAGANFSGFIPDLPGCVATGQTVGETIRNLEEAAAFHVDGLREDGVVLPESTTVAATILVDTGDEARRAS